MQSTSIILAVVALLLIPLAYAEEELTAEIRVYTEPVEVQSPFPVNHNLTRCDVDLTGFVPQMICKIMGFIPTNEDDKVWDSVKESWVTPEEVKEEYLVNKAIEDAQAKAEEPTIWEKRLVALGDDDYGASEASYRKNLNNMIGAECYQGTGRTLGMQTPASWEIPTEFVPIYKWNEETNLWEDTGFIREQILQSFDIVSIDQRGLEGAINRHVQECIAQNILDHGDIISSSYETFGYLDQFGQFYHGKIAEDIPTWSQQRVSEEANMQFKPTALDKLVCEGYYSQLYKQDYGCEIEYDMNFPIPRGDGFIEDSPFYQNYLAFRNGDQESQDAMVEKIAKQKLAEAQQRLWNQSQK